MSSVGEYEKRWLDVERETINCQKFHPWHGMGSLPHCRGGTERGDSPIATHSCEDFSHSLVSRGE